MYEWLDAALDGDSQVLTGNRRLARTLTAVFNERQFERGLSAWPTAPIRYWLDWLAEAMAGELRLLPGRVRINASQSRVLWEQVLAFELDDPLVNRGAFARQVRETWDRLQEWQVTLDDCERHARTRDHHVFVRAARRYAAILDDRSWIDGALFPARAIETLHAGRLAVPGRVFLAGFDRQPPRLDALLRALAANGVDVVRIGPTRQPGLEGLIRFETVEAEMRAAGEWARGRLAGDTDAKVAIVVPGREHEGNRLKSLVLEGLLPGWQTGGQPAAAAVNLSLGRCLADYPAIGVATLLADWLHRDLSSAEISMLLCSPFLGRSDLDVRCRVDARLRRRPWQDWTPEALSTVLSQDPTGRRALERWERALDGLAAQRAAAFVQASPASWAQALDSLLDEFGWPGRGELDSAGFQLVNRWRELLNEFSQLELVSGPMGAAAAMRRLSSMAGETIFQPESPGARVDLLGPLEAAGLEFDYLRIAGLTGADWPPPPRPLALVSRELQRERGLPDATPGDTLDYAQRVLRRLAASATSVSVSYPRFRADAEQVPCGLVSTFGPPLAEDYGRPGWAATRYAGQVGVAREIDPPPPLGIGETVAGGATTIQRQLVEPFTAFVHGRLGLRPLTKLAPGLRAWYRGNLLHEALRELYVDVVSIADIAGWDEGETLARATAAAERAFRRHYRHADALLARLLRREERRAVALVAGVVQVDRSRPPFEIESLEQTLRVDLDSVRLEIRVDRIDRNPVGERLIWDYKTGRERRFLNRNGEPDDYQLVVYACAVDGPVASLGYFNIDTRSIAISAAGPDHTPDLDWDAALGEWRDTVRVAARDLARGDVRINTAARASAARPLAILSRYAELVRDL